MYRKERKIEAHLTSEVEKRGGLCIKLISPGNNGVPDRLVLLPHMCPIFVELKAPGQRPRPLQAAMMKRIEGVEADCAVAWFDSAGAVSQFLEGYDVDQRLANGVYDDI